MAESIQLSDVAVVACLAAPHLLYAYIWYFPQQWLAAFKKQSVWVFEAVAWALKGEPPRRSRARTADPPLPLFGRSLRWPPPRRGSVPVGVLLVLGGQPGGAQPGGSPPPGVGRGAAAGWRRPGAPLLPPAARRLAGAAAALVRKCPQHASLAATNTLTLPDSNLSFCQTQVLNLSIFRAIGQAGVYYGFKLGHTVPWVHGFPFNVVSHPQYVGSVLTVWALAVLLWAQAPAGLGLLTAYWTLLYVVTGLQESSWDV